MEVLLYSRICTTVVTEDCVPCSAITMAQLIPGFPPECSCIRPEDIFVEVGENEYACEQPPESFFETSAVLSCLKTGMYPVFSYDSELSATKVVCSDCKRQGFSRSHVAYNETSYNYCLPSENYRFGYNTDLYSKCALPTVALGSRCHRCANSFYSNASQSCEGSKQCLGVMADSVCYTASAELCQRYNLEENGAKCGCQNGFIQISEGQFSCVATCDDPITLISDLTGKATFCTERHLLGDYECATSKMSKTTRTCECGTGRVNHVLGGVIRCGEAEQRPFMNGTVVASLLVGENLIYLYNDSTKAAGGAIMQYVYIGLLALSTVGIVALVFAWVAGQRKGGALQLPSAISSITDKKSATKGSGSGSDSSMGREEDKQLDHSEVSTLDLQRAGQLRNDENRLGDFAEFVDAENISNAPPEEESKLISRQIESMSFIRDMDIQKTPSRVNLVRNESMSGSEIEITKYYETLGKPVASPGTELELSSFLGEDVTRLPEELAGPKKAPKKRIVKKKKMVKSTVGEPKNYTGELDLSE